MPTLHLVDILLYALIIGTKFIGCRAFGILAYTKCYGMHNTFIKYQVLQVLANKFFGFIAEFIFLLNDKVSWDLLICMFRADFSVQNLQNNRMHFYIALSLIFWVRILVMQNLNLVRFLTFKGLIPINILPDYRTNISLRNFAY